MNNFDIAFWYLLGNEGTTFTNDPNDPGGATKYGVTLRTFRSLVDQSATVSDIENLTPDQAKVVYNLGYWMPGPMRCADMVPLEIAIAIFDVGILYGPNISAMLTQRALNQAFGAGLAIDNDLGPASLKFINEHASAMEFLAEFYEEVIIRIHNLVVINPSLEVFKVGWTKRADRLLSLTNSGFLTGLITNIK